MTTVTAISDLIMGPAAFIGVVLTVAALTGAFMLLVAGLVRLEEWWDNRHPAEPNPSGWNLCICEHRYSEHIEALATRPCTECECAAFMDMPLPIRSTP